VPDHWLLRGMVRGNRTAAGELRRRHAKSLYALAYGVLWDPDGADAVVTRVFDQAERTGREFEASGGTVFAWLSGITQVHAQQAADASPSCGTAPRSHRRQERR
jgi:DNA-directed RNA polymerase specialized sigma24 family protein